MVITIFRILLAMSVLIAFGIQIGCICQKKRQPDWLDMWVIFNGGMCLADSLHLWFGDVA